MAIRTYLAYNLFQIIQNQEFFSTRWKLVESIDAERANIKNFKEAFDYFSNKMRKVEGEALNLELTEHIKREDNPVGYFITFCYKQERTIEDEFDNLDQETNFRTDPNYCIACQSSPCECSDPDRTSTIQ